MHLRKAQLCGPTLTSGWLSPRYEDSMSGHGKFLKSWEGAEFQAVRAPPSPTPPTIANHCGVQRRAFVGSVDSMPVGAEGWLTCPPTPPPP